MYLIIIRCNTPKGVYINKYHLSILIILKLVKLFCIIYIILIFSVSIKKKKIKLIHAVNYNIIKTMIFM